MEGQWQWRGGSALPGPPAVRRPRTRFWLLCILKLGLLGEKSCEEVGVSGEHNLPSHDRTHLVHRDNPRALVGAPLAVSAAVQVHAALARVPDLEARVARVGVW